MSFRRFIPSNRNSTAKRNSWQSDRPPTYTSNVTAAPTYTGARDPNDGVRSASVLSAPDSDTLLDGTKSSVTDTLSVAETSTEAMSTTGPRYIYYRVYAEDGCLPSKTATTADDPFLGRVKATSIPPPHTVLTLKGSLAKVEEISDDASTSLCLTLYSTSPMDYASKVTILDRAGAGFIPQEPLALVAKSTHLESGARSEDLRTVVPGASTLPNSRYLYYRLYTDKYETPSRTSFDSDEPSLGRICTDCIAPPHTPANIKLCISRVEESTRLACAALFVNMSCDTPLTEGHISISHSDGPGLTPDEPIALVGLNEIFTTQGMRSKCDWSGGSRCQGWLDTTVGEIFYTHAVYIVRYMMGSPSGGHMEDAYSVRNSAGKTGMVAASNVELLS